SALGNAGKTVFYTDALEADSVDQTQSLRELVGDIDAGKVETLIIIGGNPAYNTPVDLRLDFNRLDKVKLRAHLNLYNNETSEICHWHINEAHYLEAWGDARAYDGTASIVQPLIAPLYDGKSSHEVVAMLSAQPESSGHEIVQAYWKEQHSGPDFDAFWRKSLHDGWIEGTIFAPKQVSQKTTSQLKPKPEDKAIEINFR